ncbi:MAG: hypothetical protein AB8F26_01715 [Phycisphaerales bacterium]
MAVNPPASRIQINTAGDALDAIARGLARLLASVCTDDQKTRPTSVDSPTDGCLSVPAGERLDREAAGDGRAA